MKQVLAVAVAALLIALALVVRRSLDDGDDGADGAEPGGDDGETLVVACIPELRASCAALEDVELRIEPPAATMAAPDDVDAWVTYDPWPAIAEAGDPATSPLADPVVAVAWTDLVLLTRDGAVPACQPPTTWTCLVDAGARVHAPQGAVGPLALGAAGVEFFGGPFSGNDLDADLALDSFLRSIDTRIADPVEEMLLPLGGAGPQATGATGADVALRVRTVPRGEDLVTTRTDVHIAVVVAGDDAERLADSDAFRSALSTNGYTIDPEAATTGLPSPGVLFRLQELL